MKEYEHVFEILNLTEFQKVEFALNMLEIKNPPRYFRDLNLDPERATLEAGLTLLSEDIPRHIVIQFSYPSGKLSLDAFKEYTPGAYKIYRAENFN